jgi:hypothetical protein
VVTKNTKDSLYRSICLNRTDAANQSLDSIVVADAAVMISFTTLPFPLEVASLKRG